jgi:Sec-independent protein translocase protein TatA
MGFIHFLELILIVVILLIVGVPLFGELKLKKLVEPVDPAIDEYKHLLVRKEETLISIKELEFDFNTEKISEPDYKELLHRLEKEAMRILEHLDQLERGRKKDKPQNPH